MTAFYILRLTN